MIPGGAGQHEDKFHRLVNSNIIGIVTAVSERIDTANDAFLSMVGYSRNELEQGAISWRALTPPEYDLLDDAALAELLERGECTPFRKEYIRKDGCRVPILIGAVIIAREPLEWACFILDETTHRRTEADLARALAEKEALLRQKEILLQEVNHRVKNNLQMVSALLTMQMTRVHSPEAQAALRQAMSRVSAISSIHERLYKTDDTTAVDMGAYLRSVCEEAGRSGLLDPERCLITVDAETVRLPTDRATSMALIANELLTNIAKYGCRPGVRAKVTVRLLWGVGTLRLEVEDDGPGLPPGFDPKGRSGLGMGIIAALARQHGGGVRFEAPTQGTRVIVEWPRTSKEVDAP